VLRLKWSRDSSVDTATSYGMEGPGFLSRKGPRFFSSPERPDQLWGPGTGGLSPGVKRLGREADHSPPGAESKNDGAVPPLPRTSSWRAAELSTGTTLLLW
jgi:hypothetical protein